VRRNATLKNNEIEYAVFHAIEVSLDAQLKAVRRLRGSEKESRPIKKSMSQIDIVGDVLARAGHPLHVSDIIDRAEKLHGRKIDRESIVSSLIKKVRRGDRFVRTGKNVFGLKGGA
jgi:hypothetical protein